MLIVDAPCLPALRVKWLSISAATSFSKFNSGNSGIRNTEIRLLRFINWVALALIDLRLSFHNSSYHEANRY